MEHIVNAVPFGKYELLERIAIGGMAEVFRARILGEGGFEKHLVIKRILPHLSSDAEFVRMLIDEAKIAGYLTHPNIIQIYDLGKIEGTYFIAMEFIEGGDLKIVLRRALELGVAIPIPHAIFITTEILKGLEYAHAKTVPARDTAVHLQIIHRDISPPNILLSYEGEVKIVDFGIAKAAVRVMETSAGVLKGKFEYMSPEQASGLALDQRTDLFSTGIVLYEMLTGQNPFSGRTDMQVLSNVRSSRMTPPLKLRPEMPRKLEQILVRALQREPEDRYQKASELRSELMAFAYEEGYVSSAPRLAAFMRQLFEADVRAGRSAQAEVSEARPGVHVSPDLADDGEKEIDTQFILPTGAGRSTQHAYRMGQDYQEQLTQSEDPPTIAVETVRGLTAELDGPVSPPHEASMSTQSAVSLLQTALDGVTAEASAPQPLPRVQEPSQIAVSLFQLPEGGGPQPVPLEFGFEEEEAITALHALPHVPSSPAPRPSNLAEPSIGASFVPLPSRPSPTAREAIPSAPAPAAPTSPPTAPERSPVRPPPPPPSSFFEPAPVWPEPNPGHSRYELELPNPYEAPPAPQPASYPPSPAPSFPPPSNHGYGASAYGVTPADGPAPQPYPQSFSSVYQTSSNTPSSAPQPEPPTRMIEPEAAGNASVARAVPASSSTPSVADDPLTIAGIWKRYRLALGLGFVLGLSPSILIGLSSSLRSSPPAVQEAASAPVLPSSLTLVLPPGTEAFLNENPLSGGSPVTVPIQPERPNVVRLVLPGGETLEVPVQVKGGESVRLVLPRVPAPAPAPVVEPPAGEQAEDP